MVKTEEDQRSQPLYLDCVHCGLCLPACPTYRVLGTEMDSPRGRVYLMRAFDEGRARVTDTFVQHMFRCLDCRACESACPSGVQFGHMMEEMRGKIVDERQAHWLARVILGHVFPNPNRFRMAVQFLKLYRQSGLQGLVRATRILQKIAPRLAVIEAMMPDVKFGGGVTLDSLHSAQGQKQGTVAFFAGCVMNSMLGSVNLATIRLIAAAGYDVVVPGRQVCCGALANHVGLRDTAVRMASRNMAAFPLEQLDAIIVNAAGCGAMLKEYSTLVDGARAFAAKVQDVAEFLVTTRIRDRLKRPQAVRVGYDDPCHLLHAQGIKVPPRQLLQAIPGVEYVEVEGADQCCGSAGIYNITQNELAMEILDRKMEKIAKAKLDVLATGNPGCMFQFRYGARRMGLSLEVVHPVELLARSLD